MKKRRAVVVGFEYYARFLAGLMNEHSPGWRLRAYPNSRMGMVRALLALRRADALICFGGPAPNAALTEAARRRNVPVFVIWAGSDVAKAENDPFGLEVIKQEHFINLSDGPWLVDELRSIGVEAEYLPLTAVGCGGPVKPFTGEFRVLTYLPEPRRDFYGADLVYAAARAMPDVPFMVVGPGGADPGAPSNVEFCGMVDDMQARIDASTVLLRQPQHDGKSMLVLEVLSRARHVVWNYEFPFVHTARNLQDVIAELERLRALHARGELELNHGGRAFVLENFSREDIAANFSRRLDAGVTDWAARPRRAIHRVAISGLGLFCAEIAQYTKTFAPEWEPRLLRTTSRLDVLTSMYAIAVSDVWYSIGSPIPDRWLRLAAKLLRKPRVVHWVGSDIAALSEDRSLAPMLASDNATHLAEVTWTAEQLREFGFEPRIAPLPPRHHDATVHPMPAHFTVMLYVPRTRANFYGRRSFERLMRRLRGKPIRYIVVGGGEIEAPEGVEVENLGWRDTLTDVYHRVSTLIRYTPRDGLSLMVLEALSFGRHVLWTQDFPHTHVIRNFADMEREITALLDKHMRGELHPQNAAAEMVARQYAPQRCTNQIARAWHDALLSRVNNELAPVETT